MYVYRQWAIALMFALVLTLTTILPYPVASESMHTVDGTYCDTAEVGPSASLNITIDGASYEYEVVNVTEMMEERVPDLMTNQSLVDAVRPLSHLSSGFEIAGYSLPGEHPLFVWGFNQTYFIELIVTYRCSQDNGTLTRRVVRTQTVTLDDLECSHVEVLRTTLAEARIRSLVLISPTTHRPLPGYPMYYPGADPEYLTDPTESATMFCIYKAPFYTKEMLLRPTWSVAAFNLTAQDHESIQAWPTYFHYTSNGTLLFILQQSIWDTVTTNSTTTSTETTDTTTANNTSEITNPMLGPVTAGTVVAAGAIVFVAVIAKRRLASDR